ncbi:helix-turn-helix transcriptional regulator [Cupriavidus necator]|uniref:helix-turn-helix domain-containing protein n=1 Tax=Cupriavidus necator TaxID=106590 RepID=UPI003ECFEF15
MAYTSTYIPGMGIATRLDRMMKERKVKGQSALSRLSGVPQPTIARVLKGTTDTPELGTVKKLAAALGVTATWLVEGPDDPVEYAGDIAPAAHTPASAPAAPAKLDEYAERASVLREMQFAQAAAILAALPDSALSRALGLLQELKDAETAQATRPHAEPPEQPVFARKKKVIKFTGLQTEEAKGKRGAK